MKRTKKRAQGAEVDRNAIATDLAELGRIGPRYAGSEGERAMLQAVRERLPDGVRSRIEGFVGFTSPSFVLGAHACALLVGAVLGLRWPALGALICAGTTASLFAEGSRRFSLLRWALPKKASYNLVVPPVESDEPVLGTLVLSAPLDAPRWRPDAPRWMRRPTQAVLLAAVAVTVLLLLSAVAQPWGRPSQTLYLVSVSVLVLTVGIGAVANRRTGGLDEDASGPAVVLELARRLQEKPIPHVETWLVFTGCAHAYQNGMHAFLAMRKQRVHDPVLVLSLDEVSRAPLTAVISEGALWPVQHRATGPALIERLRWAGLRIPELDQPGHTDAGAAQAWGYRALALTGGEGRSDAAAALQAAEVTETLARWFAEDVARVSDERKGLSELASATRQPVVKRSRRRGRGAPEAEPEEPVEVPAVTTPQGPQDGP